jgi:lipopolysaccharide export system protein LptA
MKYLFFCLPVLLFAAPVWAQQDTGEPIEITAVETVEWLRDKQQYVARKDVIVTQGAMVLKSDLLTADYKDTPQSSTEIWQLTAEGNVSIADETNTAYGDVAVYDVPKGLATLTGKDLKLVSPEQTVTATERMEYHANERLAKAIGNAKVVRAQDTLRADTITAYFTEEQAKPEAAAEASASNPLGGGGNIDRLEAEGNVVITTPKETLYGSKAVYRADTDTAELTGKVRVEQGENVLEGSRATVNLATNVSRMYGSEKTGGRVRGVFFPSKKNDEKGGQGNTVVAPSPSVPFLEGRGKASEESQGEGSVTPAPAPAKVSPRIAY